MQAIGRGVYLLSLQFCTKCHRLYWMLFNKSLPSSTKYHWVCRNKVIYKWKYIFLQVNLLSKNTHIHLQMNSFEKGIHINLSMIIKVFLNSFSLRWINPSMSQERNLMVQKETFMFGFNFWINNLLQESL